MADGDAPRTKRIVTGRQRLGTLKEEESSLRSGVAYSLTRLSTPKSITACLGVRCQTLDGDGFSIYGNFTVGSAKYQKGANYPNGERWVANTPSNVEGISALWQHRNYDFGLTWKRVGTYYQDNGSLSYKINGISIPFPVDEAYKIQPWNLVNFFVNYTVKTSSHFRGTKIQLAFNNLANSHSLVGITPGTAATATTPYTQSPNDLLNLLPGRSISLTITGGYAPKR